MKLSRMEIWCAVVRRREAKYMGRYGRGKLAAVLIRLQNSRKSGTAQPFPLPVSRSMIAA